MKEMVGIHISYAKLLKKKTIKNPLERDASLDGF